MKFFEALRECQKSSYMETIRRKHMVNPWRAPSGARRVVHPRDPQRLHVKQS